MFALRRAKSVARRGRAPFFSSLFGESETVAPASPAARHRVDARPSIHVDAADRTRRLSVATTRADYVGRIRPKRPTSGRGRRQRRKRSPVSQVARRQGLPRGRRRQRRRLARRPRPPRGRRLRRRQFALRPSPGAPRGRPRPPGPAHDRRWLAPAWLGGEDGGTRRRHDGGPPRPRLSPAR